MSLINNSRAPEFSIFLSTKYTFIIVQFFIICVSMIEKSSLSLASFSISSPAALSLATLFFVYKIHLRYSPIFYYLRIDDRREFSLSLTSFSISSPTALSLTTLSSFLLPLVLSLASLFLVLPLWASLSLLSLASLSISHLLPLSLLPLSLLAPLSFLASLSLFLPLSLFSSLSLLASLSSCVSLSLAA